MTIYARKEICGCKPGEKVEVYGTYIEDGCIMFVVWAKSLKMWVRVKMHPFLAIYLIAQALEEMLWRAGETGDNLQIDLSNGNAREILNGITGLIANDIEQALEKKGGKQCLK